MVTGWRSDSTLYNSLLLLWWPCKGDTKSVVLSWFCFIQKLSSASCWWPCLHWAFVTSLWMSLWPSPADFWMCCPSCVAQRPCWGNPCSSSRKLGCPSSAPPWRWPPLVCCRSWPSVLGKRGKNVTIWSSESKPNAVSPLLGPMQTSYVLRWSSLCWTCCAVSWRICCLRPESTFCHLGKSQRTSNMKTLPTWRKKTLEVTRVLPGVLSRNESQFVFIRRVTDNRWIDFCSYHPTRWICLRQNQIKSTYRVNKKCFKMKWIDNRSWKIPFGLR